MPLQSSGQISLNDIHIEAGGTTGTEASINDTDIRGLIDKSSATQMSFSEWYGASAYSGEALADALGTTTTRNYVESLAVGNGKRSYTGTGFYNEGNPATYRYSTAPNISVAWGAIPSAYEGASGATVLYYNYATSASNVTSASITSGGVQRSISLSNYNYNLSHGNVRIGYFGSSSSNYNLDGATIKGTFNKASQNSDNCQTVFGFPGYFTRVSSGIRTNAASSTYSSQVDDIVILFSSATGDGYYSHNYLDTSGLSKQRGTRRTRWYQNHNVSVWKCTGTSFNLRGSTTDRQATVCYFQLRYAG